MGNYTIIQMFENPRRGRQARNFTANVPKILDLESSSEQMFFFRKLTLHGCPRFQSSHHKTPFVYSQSLQHLTIAVLLIKILIVFRPLSSVHLFQSNQSLEAIENRFDQATIINQSQFAPSPLGMPGTITPLFLPFVS